jgi:cysteine desulfurase
MRQDRLEELKLLRLMELTGGEVKPEDVDSLALQYKLDEDPLLKRWAQAVRTGAQVTYLDVQRDGRVDLEALEAAITERTILVSVMFANNGSAPCSRWRRSASSAAVGEFSSTPTQCGRGKVPFDVERMKIDLASITAHRSTAPRASALYVRRKPRASPRSSTAAGTSAARSGHLNVAGIVGFGKAAEIARTEMAAESARVLALRERLRATLNRELDMVILNGSLEHRLAGNFNVSFAYVEGEALMMAIKDVAVSSGSACTSASLEPSYVLRALGVEEDMAHSSIRFGLGRFNTEAQVDMVARLVVEKVRKLREMSPLYEMVRGGIDLKSIA